MTWIEREEIKRKWGNVESLSVENLSPFPHSLSISSPFPVHFLIPSSFPRSPAARLQRFVQPCTGVPVVLKTLWILMATPNNIVFRLWALSRDNLSLRCRLHKKSMTEKDIFIEKTCLYFSFSDSMAFLLSLTLARKADPRTDITTLVENHDSYHINIQQWMSDANFVFQMIRSTNLEIPGRYWLAYIRGRTGRKQIQDSGNLFTIATRDSSAHLELLYQRQDQN